MASLPVETVQAIANAEVGVGGIINSTDPVDRINNFSQSLSAAADLVGNPLGVIATNGLALQVALAKMQLDSQDGKPLSPADVLSAVGNIVAMAAAGAIILSPVGRAATIFKIVSITLGVSQVILPLAISDAAAATNNAAKAVLPRRDPLTLDLDGDGLETTAIAATNPILFDHDGDGIKNGTGWVKPDDGFLVRDVNGNGTIDNGRELFGDSTIKSNGQTAKDGFDALADLDSNLDGKIDSLDTQFANLRIWRDLNQDGISQTGELFTLASLNIASINVAKTAHSQTLANGNQIADIGSYTKTDGTQVAVGEVTGSLADINLASDTFHRSFTNVLDTTSVATLPDMQGSGKVRDLRQVTNDVEWRVAA